MFFRLSLGVFRQGIRDVKEMSILTKSTFCCVEFFRGSLVYLWFVLGLLPERNREGTTGRNLKKCTQIDYPTRSKLLEKSKQSKLFRLPPLES